MEGYTDLKGDKGCLKKVLLAGNGAKAVDGKKCIVHYTGTFPDGKVFDSSVQRGTPFEFVLGAKQVIKGWDEGVASMVQGEKAHFILNPDYAYGPRGAGGVIPPNATLHFEVEFIKQ